MGRGKERGNKYVLILNLHLDPQMCRTGLATTLSLDETSPPWKEVFLNFFILCAQSQSSSQEVSLPVFKHRQVYFVVIPSSSPVSLPGIMGMLRMDSHLSGPSF